MRLLYLSSNQIRIQNRDGSNDYALTDDTLQSFSPFWSPDDKQIIFVASEDYQNNPQGLFYIINADGSNLKTISEEKFPLPVRFALSPSGEEIAFYAEPSFALLAINSGETTELFQTEFPDYISSITWQP